MPRKKIERCPFCGAKGVEAISENNEKHVWWCWCSACDTSGPPSNDESDAINQWNRRFGYDGIEVSRKNNS